MDIASHTQRLAQEFAALAETGGDESRALLQRLAGALEPTIRLALIEALADAADEISREMAPGSVELRLRGREPSFVVALPSQAASQERPEPAKPVDDETHEGGPTARINFRPPEQLKAAIEAAAALEGRSVNSWLTRVSSSALRRHHQDQPPPVPPTPPRHTNRYTGWAR